MSEPLWTPSEERIANANVTKFRKAVEQQWSVDIPDSNALVQFSVDEREKFWDSLKGFARFTAKTWGDRVLVNGDKMPGAKWFPDARINFSENLLKYRGNEDALVFRGEDRVERRMSRDELRDAVSVVAQALKADGVGVGDRVGAYIANMPEAAICMLATVSLGATWSSCSPDFGVNGVLDRFGQIEPKVMIAVDGYFYNGKTHDICDKVAEIANNLPTVQRVLIVPYTNVEPDVSSIANAVTLPDYTSAYNSNEIAYAYVPFDHPLYILYSSGTTGKPKCIVHETGGMLLKHGAEHMLSSDIKEGDRVFWFTTCGWMMWNWLVGSLAFGATALLYDGSPFYPDRNVAFDFAEAESMTLFGTSAKYIDTCNKAGLNPKETHDLSSMRTLGSTGSTLVPEGFDYVYNNIKPDIHLMSMSGGTDIAGCFCGGDPTKPVWRGEIQGRTPGMAADVFDDNGNHLPSGKGELVCTKAFPTVPSFLNDPGDERLIDTYFNRFANTWTHGDFVEWTEHGGMIIHGRSDATLNPAGVRIGTAEIYRQVEKLDEVLESIVIGQNWDNDVRIVLFVILREGIKLDEGLSDRIKGQVKDNCTPRHAPQRVVQVTDIPRTKSGKITELAVRDVVHGRTVQNAEALANPEALDQFKNRDELSA